VAAGLAAAAGVRHWLLTRAGQDPAAAEGRHLARGRQLYNEHCATCHGERGDGNGPNAGSLSPRPRNFRADKFRLVTTVNRVPSDEDLLRVILRGIPGSAMPPLVPLGAADAGALVAYVRRLTRDGVEERLRAAEGADGEPLDPADVARQTEPGEAAAVPDDWPLPEPASLARGADLFRRNCASCHGATGRGDGAQALVDDGGLPTRARDFTRGVLKGGPDRRQLACRILLGMPGTPMPAQAALRRAEVGDLVNYVLSLSDPDGGGTP
jgi:cytochrome c oxidase cbb3-type subunit 2